MDVAAVAVAAAEWVKAAADEAEWGVPLREAPLVIAYVPNAVIESRTIEALPALRSRAQNAALR